MKHTGCSIIFVNDENQVLLFLRDDKPGLPYAGMWDVPGGHAEPDESPETCIIREMKEEILYDLSGFDLFRIYDFRDRIEYVFWKNETFDLEKTVLTEGQRLCWFSVEEVSTLSLAYGFNEVLNDFFREILF